MVTKSGKTVEVKLPTRKDSIKLRVASAVGYAGFEVWYDAALIGTGLPAVQLEEQFSDVDILEISAEVFRLLRLSDEQKKS
jgi:hypothetical protein